MPRASKEEQDSLATLGPDCSLLLTHLIRQNGNRQKTDSQARDILASILALGRRRKPVLLAGDVGWFGRCSDANCFDPSCGDLTKVPVEKSVCFTESTLAGLRAHRDVFRAKYGLAFDRECLFGRGANPCMNIRDNILKEGVRWYKKRYDQKLFNFIPQRLRPFVNVINRGFDATHEREWRFVGNLEFARVDVRLVFCPEADFAVFSRIQKKGTPTLFDLAWLDRF